MMNTASQFLTPFGMSLLVFDRIISSNTHTHTNEDLEKTHDEDICD